MKTLALAFAALALSAGAASAQEYRVTFGDLDLASISGADAFDARVATVARRACRGATPLAERQCRSRFQAEAMRLLPGVRRDDYARARGGRQLAMIPVHHG
jgi:UrcA family protein